MSRLEYLPQTRREVVPAVQAEKVEVYSAEWIESLRSDKRWLEKLVCVISVCLGISTGAMITVVSLLS